MLGLLVGDLRRRAARRARPDFAGRVPPIPHDLDDAFLDLVDDGGQP